jgi:hypothetical protein
MDIACLGSAAGMRTRKMQATGMEKQKWIVPPEREFNFLTATGYVDYRCQEF